MALSGIALEAMDDFALSVTNAHVNEKYPISFAGLKNYAWGRAANKRREASGGKGFDMTFKTDTGQTGLQAVLPGGYRTPQRYENVFQMSQRYVKYHADLMILDDEVEKNLEWMAYLKAGRKDLFFDELFSIYLSRRQDLALRAQNGMESIFSAVPNFDTMENRSNTCTAATSFFAHVNEWQRGCFGMVTDAGINGTTGTSNQNAAAILTGVWSTKQGINPTAAKYNSKLQPTRMSYSSIAANNEANPLNAIKRAIRASTYEKPPSVPNTVDSQVPTISDEDDLIIYTGDKGMTHVENSILASQDLWVSASREDPAVLSPMVRGHEIAYWAALDTAAIYAGGTNTTLVTEGAATCDAIGPRYYGHRRKSLYVVSHVLNWFRMRNMQPHPNIPDARVSYLDVEPNWFCEDWRGQFVVYPASSLYSAY